MKSYAKPNRARRGVVLMIVLALLATFAIVAMTFLLAASQTHQAAVQYLEADTYRFSPEAMLMESGMWVLRGDKMGGAGNHSLLADMYDKDGDVTTSTLTYSISLKASMTCPYVRFSNANENWVGRAISVMPGNHDAGSRYEGLCGFVVKVEGGTAYVLPYAFQTAIPEGTASVRVIVNPFPYQGNGKDYDAPDANNVFLSSRDPNTGQVKIVSYRGYNAFSQGDETPVVDSDNDGKADSIWLDLRFPAFAAPDGRKCKPLVAVLVEDLDNRLCPNTHGQLYIDNIIYGGASFGNPFKNLFCTSRTAAVNNPQTSFERYGAWGAGFGPAEIPLYSLALTTSGTSLGSYNTAIRTNIDYLMSRKFNALESSSQEPKADRLATYNTRGQWFKPYNPTERKVLTGASFTQATPLDIRGVLAIGVDTTGSPLYGRLHNDYAPMQAINLYSDFSKQSAEGKKFLRGNTYDVDIGLYGKHGLTMRKSTSNDLKENWDQSDAPYSVVELEALLRPFDTDSAHLPQRLRKLVAPWGNDAANNNRFVVTTELWNSPTIHDAESIRNNMKTKLNNDAPMELRAGLPFDMLRLAIIDDSLNPGVADHLANGDYTVRQRYAKCIYELLETLGINMGGEHDQKRNNAQWAVNVIDFFDADNVMTPFNYEGGKWVYGCERPELLISETLAMHSRNTEDDPPAGGGGQGGTASSEKAGGKRGKPTNVDGQEADLDTTVYETYNPDKPETIPEKVRQKVLDAIALMPDGAKPDGTEDLDQRLRPQGTVMISLYNAWSNHVSGARQEPCDTDSFGLWSTEGGVNLTKTNGNSPVWRLVVANHTDDRDPDEYLHTGGSMTNVDRVIHFANVQTTPDSLSANVVYGYSGSAKVIPPGRHAVIGPSGTTALSFNDAKGAEDSTPEIQRRIELNNTALSIDGANQTNVIPVPIDPANNARLSLTEFGDYPTENLNANTLEYSAAFDKPFDLKTVNGKRDSDLINKLASNDNHWNYRMVHLQRLANPARPFDSRNNPYITVDSMPIDLHTYNARTSDKEIVDGKEKSTGEMSAFKIYTRKRGQSLFNSNNPRDSKHANISMIWRQERSSTDVFNQCRFAACGGGGTFSGDFAHCFGSLGRTSTTGSTKLPFDSETSGALQGMPTKKPIPWLTWLNRTPTGPADLMLVPNRSASRLLRDYDVERDGQARTGESIMGYLPNFRTGSRYKLFEYFRMPSQQVASPMIINRKGADRTLPFAYYSQFREPGKLNINTIYSEKVFRSLMGRPKLDQQVYDPVNTNGDLWANFLSSRGGSRNEPWKVTKPFRSFNSGAGMDSTILRHHPSSTSYGLFEHRSTEPWNSTENQAFFRYQNYNRMMNMTTTRSSVFAVWVTIGLFEVDANGNVLKRNVGGRQAGYEVGEDNGTVHRYRAFFIMDRSLPVGFQKGKNVNADRAMLIRRFL